GLGSTGGFKLQIEDRANKGFDELFKPLNLVISGGSTRPQLMGLYSTFRIQVPHMDIQIDREQAMLQGVPLEQVFDALQVYLGSLY
ncbi:efflux RND transporter permease subunit, partial [Vibrio parahaemolyticus]|uniref:efflux RND transporter permease subunit n=1 Tax=Vibrio parahaemolyticus TaxID=670 RepID=UPI001A8DD2EE